MALLLLESTVIIDHLNGRLDRTGFLDQLWEQGFDLGCCAVNIKEVYAGLRVGEEAKTAEFLNSLECLPVTQGIARQAGLLSREWLKKGITLSYSDVTIAAVAINNEIPLITDNRKHSQCPSFGFPFTRAGQIGQRSDEDAAQGPAEAIADAASRFRRSLQSDEWIPCSDPHSGSATPCTPSHARESDGGSQERGGEPSSVEFCYRAGMNYVSCSPYRVPIARLAAAKAAISGGDSSETNRTA